MACQFDAMYRVAWVSADNDYDRSDAMVGMGSLFALCRLLETGKDVRQFAVYPIGTWPTVMPASFGWDTFKKWKRDEFEGLGLPTSPQTGD